MNRRAIVLHFIITILLALIIFIPACLFVSKFFRVSEQASDNFSAFVKELQQTASDGKERSFLIIMDKSTALIYFEPSQQQVIVKVDTELPYTDYTIQLQNPGRCGEKGCLCLFQEPEVDATWWKPGYDTVTVLDSTARCQELAFPLRLENCGVGTAKNVHSYTCEHGFMIERRLAEDSSWATESYYEAPRRLAFKIMKQGETIFLKQP